MTSRQNSSLASSATFAPGLYLVATPIGNLQDISLRAIETLKVAEVILCEDTRVTARLLNHYDIHRPLAVYNDHSEHHDHNKILDRLRAGQVVALVSDAGMPLLSDPGYQLVRAVQNAGLMVTTVPGASSILAALQLSGLPTDAFMFIGFLSTKSGERQTRLTELATVPATLLTFERAERVADVLADVIKVMGDRRVAIVREITKLFEETRRGLASDLIAGLDAKPIKGEVVLVIDRDATRGNLTDDELRDRLRTALKDASMRDAVDLVTDVTGMSRKHIYDLALSLKNSDE